MVLKVERMHASSSSALTIMTSGLALGNYLFTSTTSLNEEPNMRNANDSDIVKAHANELLIDITRGSVCQLAISSLFFSLLAGIGKQQHHEDGYKRLMKHHKLDVIIF